MGPLDTEGEHMHPEYYREEGEVDRDEEAAKEFMKRVEEGTHPLVHGGLTTWQQLKNTYLQGWHEAMVARDKDEEQVVSDMADAEESCALCGSVHHTAAQCRLRKDYKA